MGAGLTLMNPLTYFSLIQALTQTNLLMVLGIQVVHKAPGRLAA